MTSERKSRSEYGIWNSMRTRCNNPKYRWFANYGGRGIEVCERWDSFENFLADMGPRPEGLTLERKDNDRNYEPDNCRWATRQEQNNNRRSNHIVEFRGEKMSLGTARIISNSPVSFGALTMRLRRGWDLERALTKPTMSREQVTAAHRAWRQNGSPRRSQNV